MTPSAGPGGIDKYTSIVGVSTEQILELLGSEANSGALYLAGSLSAGLGNKGSDVDIQIFIDAEEVPNSPMLFFIGKTRIDVQCYSSAAPERLAQQCVGRSVRIGKGHCLLDAALVRSDAKALSRWLSAVPLDSKSPPLVDNSRLSNVKAMLVRQGLEEALRLAVLGEISQGAGIQEASLVWARVGRAVVEVANRINGDLFIGDKWAWRKATRTGIDPYLIRTCSNMSCLAHWHEAMDLLRLPLMEIRSLAQVQLQQGDEVRVGNSRYRLAQGRTLVPWIDDVDVLEDDSATIALLRAGGAHLNLKHEEIGRRLEGRNK